MSAPVTIPKGAVFTEADVRFMQGMIAHHAQAIYMSRMAAAHGANPRVLKFANKIDQSQIAEIRLMQDWLLAQRPVRARHVVVAHDDDAGHAHRRTARGSSTRRRAPTSTATFLTLMIQHHEGALKMVADLFATPLAAQDVDVSVFANDVADRADRRDRDHARRCLNAIFETTTRSSAH